MPEGVWFPSSRMHGAGKQKARSFQVFQVKHQKLGPLYYLFEVLCADSWGEIFTRTVALHPTQQVMQWSPAAGGTPLLPHLREMPCTSLWSPHCPSVSSAVKKVDPVYCEAELIPHHRRL